jgi:t-SNARE complex subunit (syntaxin)
MTNTLQMLNMPSRMEVTSLAERAVNIEMRLDDLDAKLSTNQTALLAAMKNTMEAAVRDAVQATVQDAVRQALATQTRHWRSVEGHLTALEAQITALQRAVTPAPATEKAQEG